MEINGKDVYFVAVKVLLRDGDKLLITHDVFGSWDLPGGRIKKDEFEKPLEEVVARKMKEELGDHVTYDLGKAVVYFRHERDEHGVDFKVRIFAIGYEAEYKGGEVAMGKNHERHEWVDVTSFTPADYFEGGWLIGVQEYIDKVKGEYEG